MEEDYLVRHLVLSLNEQLKDKMAMNGDPLWSLDKHISQLRSWQSAWDTYQGLMPHQTLSPGVPMDVDHKKSTTIHMQNLPKLTPNEKECMGREKRCFCCCEPGHNAATCTGPPQVRMSAKTTGPSPVKGKTRQEVVDDESQVEESEKEEEVTKKKKTQKAKAMPSTSQPSSSHSPPSNADNEEDPPSYQDARVSIMNTLA